LYEITEYNGKIVLKIERDNYDVTIYFTDGSFFTIEDKGDEWGLDMCNGL
jgi:hypothetical protein